MDSNNAEWGRYERMRPAQIDAVLARAPIAYVPWGALEWHSYHNPIGLDGMQAYGQCCALAQATGGVVLPALYLGTDTIKPFKGFAHSIEHRSETVAAVCHELMEQLGDEGFAVVIIVTGHCGGGHVDALRRAVDAFVAEHERPRVLLVPSFEPIQAEHPSNHAARGETSFQLLFDPELVELAALPDDRRTTLDDDGVWGEDPREASADEGRRMLALFVERLAPRIRRMLDQ